MVRNDSLAERFRGISSFKMTKTRRETLAAAAFLAPNVILFLLLTLGPTLFSFAMGFTRWNGLGSPRWTGIQNYLRLATDGLFLKSVANTAIYTIEFVPIVPCLFHWPGTSLQSQGPRHIARAALLLLANRHRYDLHLLRLDVHLSSTLRHPQLFPGDV